MKRVFLYLIGVLALASLVLITSCTPSDQTVSSIPLEEQQPVAVISNQSSPLDAANAAKGLLCANATCAKDQVCVKGKCQCQTGFKSCAGSCIPKASCCSEKDCQGTETCLNNQCQFSCSRVICPTNQNCDESQKRCTCPTAYRFCEVQNKCIPTENCCDKFDCGRGLICTATVNSAQVCLSLKSPVCKYFGDKTNKILSLLNNQTFDVTAAEFLYGKKVKILVDGKPFVLENGAREVLNGSITLQVSDVREIGGKCRVPKDREKL